MRLTTLTRVKRRAPVTGDSLDALLQQLITSASLEVEKYLDRHMLRTARTETFDIRPGQRTWYLPGYPIDATPTPEVRLDVDRAFTGDEEDSSSYHLRREDGRLVLDFTYNTWSSDYTGALQVIYTGGMAPSLDSLSAAISGLAGSFTASEVVTGGTSGATGTYVSGTSTTIVLTVTNGVFEQGETLTGATSAATATLGAATATPLVMAYPDLVEAVNELVTMRFQRKDQVGLTSYASEGASVSYWDTPLGYPKSVQAVLERYRNLAKGR